MEISYFGKAYAVAAGKISFMIIDIGAAIINNTTDVHFNLIAAALLNGKRIKALNPHSRDTMMHGCNFGGWQICRRDCYG